MNQETLNRCSRWVVNNMNPNHLQLEDVFDSDFVDELKVLYNYKIKIKKIKQKKTALSEQFRNLIEKNVEKGKIDTINRQIHNRSHSWLGIGTLRSYFVTSVTISA